ncbi:GDP-mannose-dependent alpha-(1-6)-phosphatidylinositol monomannoside mannosyltransferase [compost metagenome]
MYAGRLEYIKGVHILIRALGLLQQRRRDWTCVIAGSGSLLEELKLQAQALGVQDDIEFAGTIDNIPAALTSADIYVQPSLQDTQPFSVTEAQLAGIAPVVAGTTGMPEMVQHGLTGWIVPADNAAALAGQLELLLRDDSLRARAGTAAQRWARANRSLDTMAEGTLKAYRRAAEMHGWPQRSRPAGQSGHHMQGAFHPADLLNVITPGNPLESVLRSRLPADYRIPDANIFPG